MGRVRLTKRLNCFPYVLAFPSTSQILFRLEDEFHHCKALLSRNSAIRGTMRSFVSRTTGLAGLPGRGFAQAQSAAGLG